MRVRSPTRETNVIKGLTLVAVVLVVAGCHQYVPAPAPVSPGTRVRVRLTVAGAIRVSEARGEPRRQMEGTLVRASRDTLTLAVPRLGIEARQLRAGFPTADTVVISRNDVEAMDAERISRKRTALLAGGISAVVGVALRQAIHEGGSTGEGDPADPLKGIVSVLLRFLGHPAR